LGKPERDTVISGTWQSTQPSTQLQGRPSCVTGRLGSDSLWQSRGGLRTLQIRYRCSCCLPKTRLGLHSTLHAWGNFLQGGQRSIWGDGTSWILEKRPRDTASVWHWCSERQQTGRTSTRDLAGQPPARHKARWSNTGRLSQGHSKASPSRNDSCSSSVHTMTF
jgi:hypothetical protein